MRGAAPGEPQAKFPQRNRQAQKVEEEDGG